MSSRDIVQAAAAALPLPTFVSSSVGISAVALNTVTAPSGIEDGDLLIAIGQSVETVRWTAVPTGFSVLSHQAGGNTSICVATKVASSESGNYAFTWSGAIQNSVSVLVYRNATAVNTIGTYAEDSIATSVATSITPTYTGILLAAFCNKVSAAISTPPSGMTQRSVSASTTPSFAAYDAAQEPSASGTKTLVWDTGTGSVISLLIQITNEPTVAPEFVASASTQTGSGVTVTVNKPTGTVEGDLMVAVCQSNANTTWTGDTDWVEVAEQGATKPSLRVAYKVAGASEPSTYTFTLATNEQSAVSILTYRYAAYDTIGSFTTGANPLILPSISPSESQSVLIAAGARAAPSITLGTPISMTARVTDNDASIPSYIVCDQTVAKGPTGTRSMSTGSTTSVAGIMLSIKPTRSL